MKNRNIIFSFDIPEEKKFDFQMHKTVKNGHLETSGGTYSWSQAEDGDKGP